MSKKLQKNADGASLKRRVSRPVPPKKFCKATALYIAQLATYSRGERMPASYSETMFDSERCFGIKPPPLSKRVIEVAKRIHAKLKLANQKVRHAGPDASK